MRAFKRKVISWILLSSIRSSVLSIILSAILAAVIILILALYLIKEQKQGKEEITKITDEYISNLLPQVREAGVIEIKILSSDIKVRIIRATAKLDIVFRVYNPSTQQTRTQSLFTLKNQKAIGKYQMQSTIRQNGSRIKIS